MTDTNSPDSYAGPAWLVLLPSLVSGLSQVADASEHVRRIAGNLGIAWALPWVGVALAVAPIIGGAVWFWRRAVGRGKPWALKLERWL